jgi:large subunit ribosomal protein L21
MLAIIKTGGKQYKVQPKDKVKIEKVSKKENEEIIFDEVLLTADGDKIQVGNPLVKGAKVKAKVLRQGRAKKVEVVKFKSKVRYKRKYGHRQPFTEVEIISI